MGPGSEAGATNGKALDVYAVIASAATQSIRSLGCDMDRFVAKRSSR
jgi:hypothetical protein